MNAKEFFDAVAAMRDAQKEYFRTRTREALTESKRLEKKIDAEIARARSFLAGLPAKEPQLFPTDEK